MKELTKEQNELVIRLFVAREEQRTCDMQRYWANVYAPVDKTGIIIELFWEEYIEPQELMEIKKEKTDEEIIDEIPF